MTVKLSTLGVGDVIRAERTMKVTRVDNAYVGVQFEDVQSGQTFVVDFDSNQGSWKPELVSKAAPPKPKVGDKVTRRAKLAHLEPGSVVVNSWGYSLIVGTKGTVAYDGHVTGFNDSMDNSPYTIVYLP